MIKQKKKKTEEKSKMTPFEAKVKVTKDVTESISNMINHVTKSMLQSIKENENNIQP